MDTNVTSWPASRSALIEAQCMSMPPASYGFGTPAKTVATRTRGLDRPAREREARVRPEPLDVSAQLLLELRPQLVRKHRRLDLIAEGRLERRGGACPQRVRAARAERPHEERRDRVSRAVHPRLSGGRVVSQLELGRPEGRVDAEKREDGGKGLVAAAAQLVAVDYEDLAFVEVREVLLELEPVVTRRHDPVAEPRSGEHLLERLHLRPV